MTNDVLDSALTSERITQMEAELAALNERYKQLREQEIDLKSKLDVIVRLRKELRESFLGDATGKIPKLHNKIAEQKALFERQVQDETCRTVYWVNDTRPSTHIVTRMTAKRIYVRERGHQSETFYELDGTRRSRYGDQHKIDILRTFPEGLKQ